MNLSDEELMLLEQLCYIDSGLADQIGLSAEEMLQADSVRELMAYFDAQTLAQLESAGTFYYTQGTEWAAMIRAIQADSNLMELDICDVKYGDEGDLLAITYGNKENADQAVVTFHGTVNANEWKDNVQGMNSTDTPAQEEALDYIESLKQRKLTVVGHSKGGNKAQYVTITSQKVERCVSLDGQGFSKEFLNKYRYEIRQKAACIRGYSLDNDFVHILLSPIPGAKQVYVKGNGIESAAENHSPNSFFKYKTLEDGHTYLILDGGKKGPGLEKSERESPGMEWLHGFTVFAADTLNEKEKDDLVYYLGAAAALLRSQDSVEYKGKVYTQEKLRDFITSDTEMLALLGATILIYTKYNPLTEKELSAFIEDFGGEKLLQTYGYGVDNKSLEQLLEKLVSGEQNVLAHSTDGKNGIVGTLLLLTVLLFTGNTVRLRAFGLWREIEKKAVIIEKRRLVKGDSAVIYPSNRCIDYSDGAFAFIMQIIKDIENCSPDYSAWEVYASEEWYTSVGAEAALAGIKGIFEELRQENMSLTTIINARFYEMNEIDRMYANKIMSLSIEI